MQRPFPREWWLGGCVLGLFLAGPTTALATDEWIQPRVRLGLEHSDNAFFSPTTIVREGNMLFDGSVSTGLSESWWTLSGDLNYIGRFYEKSSNLNQNNFYVSGSGLVRGERLQAGLTARYANDSVIQVDRITSDAGATGTDTVRNSLSIAPSLSWAVTQTVTLGLNVAGEDATYNDTPNQYYDYRYATGTLRASWALSERLTTAVVGTTQVYESDESGVRQTTLGGQLGVDYRATEGVRGRAYYGYSENKSEQELCTFLAAVPNPAPPPLLLIVQGVLAKPSCGALPINSVSTSTSRTPIWSFGVTGDWERYTANADYSQSTSASGSGSGQLQRSLSLDLRRKFEGGRFDAGLRVYGVQARANLVQGLSSINRDFLLIEPRVGWRFSDDWWVSGTYRFRDQHYTDATVANPDSRENSVSLAVEWVPAGMGQGR